MTQAFVEEVRKVVAVAEARYNLDLSGVAIRCDIRGYRMAGQAGWRGRNGRRNWFLRFHPVAISNYWNEMVTNTIPHEVAHTVCQKRPELGRNHDFGWKRVCRELGGNPTRLHRMDLGKANARRAGITTSVSKKFLYSCENGDTIELGLGRHNSLRSGKVTYYKCARRGKIEASGFIKRVV